MTRHAITDDSPLVKGLPRGQQLKTLPCPICGKTFTQTRWWQKQCSVKCTDRAYKLRQVERLRAEIRREVEAEMIEPLSSVADAMEEAKQGLARGARKLAGSKR